MARKSPSTKKTSTIVVAGDATVDWFEMATPALGLTSLESNSRFNWQNYPGIYRFARPGGALLLANLICSATDANIIAPEVSQVENVSPDKVVHSFVSLGEYPYSLKEKRGVYRIREFKGYAGVEKAAPLPVQGSVSDADIVVLNDAGGSFRDADTDWPEALNTGTWIVWKTTSPLGKGKLAEKIGKYAERLITVVEADDLRQEGAKISRRLSWERTAQECVWQITYNPAISFLNDCAYLIVRFGVEGAILYQPAERCSWLFFDPKIGEGSFAEVYPGKMMGLGCAFTAGLISQISEKIGKAEVKAGILQGLCSMRRLWQLGFVKQRSELSSLDYPYADLWVPLEQCDFKIAEAEVPAPTVEPDARYWSILEGLNKSVEEMAYHFVIYGRDPALDQVPVGVFGNFVTLDRSEIESFNSIKNLIKEYLDSPGVNRPLSIAVFGPPGAGKSFSVTEVAKSVAPEKLSETPLEFNLSQFKTIDELITALHKVRDIGLSGKVPIVFFDEFDASFNGKLGWLKYFLAPMQDGKFRDGEVDHPIGKAIFVFAGGIYSTFTAFSEQNDPEFKTAKVPDFISRLRGYVNIKGPNPESSDLDDDRLYMIRRAMVLRFLLKKEAPNIFDEKNKCRIDSGVLRALIKVPRYKHGIRSIQAVIEMSVLSNQRSFEQAALPSPEQLELHVDAREFNRLAARDVFLRIAREKIAMAIHENYRRENKDKKPANDPSMVPWEQLREDLRESNRKQADDIPIKLRAIACDFIPATDREPAILHFTEAEIEKLAEMEHARWVKEKRDSGWTQGEPRDDRRKIHPHLVEWGQLPDSIKEYDRNAVRAIPELLAQAGFEIYRLE